VVGCGVDVCEKTSARAAWHNGTTAAKEAEAS
jgi:hypothetical protein